MGEEGPGHRIPRPRREGWDWDRSCSTRVDDTAQSMTPGERVRRASSGQGPPWSSGPQATHVRLARPQVPKLPRDPTPCPQVSYASPRVPAPCLCKQGRGRKRRFSSSSLGLSDAQVCSAHSRPPLSDMAALVPVADGCRLPPPLRKCCPLTRAPIPPLVMGPEAWTLKCHPRGR